MGFPCWLFCSTKWDVESACLHPAGAFAGMLKLKDLPRKRSMDCSTQVLGGVLSCRAACACLEERTQAQGLQRGQRSGHNHERLPRRLPSAERNWVDESTILDPLQLATGQAQATSATDREIRVSNLALSDRSLCWLYFEHDKKKTCNSISRWSLNKRHRNNELTWFIPKMIVQEKLILLLLFGQYFLGKHTSTTPWILEGNDKQGQLTRAYHYLLLSFSLISMSDRSCTCAPPKSFFREERMT